MSSRPTDSASTHFRAAGRHAATASRKALTNSTDVSEFNINIGIAINELSTGLTDLASGMRATYLLIEKLEREIR